MRNPFRKIKWFIQRGRRGWADCDTWALDQYVSEWMPDALRHLHKHKHGLPIEVLEQCGPVDELGGFSSETWIAAEQLWAAKIDSIIAGFEAHKKILDLDFDWKDPNEFLKLDAIRVQGFKDLTEHWGDLWD